MTITKQNDASRIEAAPDRSSGKSAEETSVSRWLRWAIEAVTLVMVVGSPWAFGCADPPFEFYLHIGIGIIAVLWAVRMAVQTRLQWQFSPVALSLLAIFAIGLYQLVPLPRGLLHTISPASVNLVDRLLPDQPEVLPFGLEADANLQPPNQTLSMYPAATRYALFRLLAVLVLFEAVRNVCGNRAALKRLSVCAFSNAVALSFLAILQFLSSPPNTVYWSYTLRTAIFGPFLCRNHFPFYVNICLGLGLGLFFAAMDRPETDKSSRSRGRGSRYGEPFGAELYEVPFPKNLFLRLSGWIQALLSNPTALWISAGIAVIVCADFLSLSRGGVLALVAASLACLVYKSFTLSSRSLSAGMIVIFGIAFGLVNWLGWNLVEARLGTLLSKDALSNRTPMWTDGLLAFEDFPIFGTGYGTFQYVEPLHRTFAGEVVVFFDHAHNDYLEAAVEGGLFRLIAALCAIGFVYVAGYRSLRRLSGGRSAELVLGALVGFTTVVVHSFGEFGLFTPAITVLTAVVVAQICGSEVWSLNHLARTPASEQAKAVSYTLRLAGFAPALGVLVAFVVAAMLIVEAHRADWQGRFRNAAERLRDAVPDASERRIALLNEAVRWGADSAWSQLELGEVYLNTYQSKVDLLDLYGTISPVFGVTMTSGGLSSFVVGASRVASEPAGLVQLAPSYESAIDRKYLAEALRCFIQARNLCPVLARAQLRLVALAAKLDRADQPVEYLERARILAGYDPEFWFMGGALALAEKRNEDCWPLWNRSLAISKRHFREILNQARLVIKPQEILDKLLPDSPELIVESANLLLPNPKSEEERAVRAEYFKRAAYLLRQETGEINADGWVVRAWVSQELGQDKNAITALRMAISLNPKYEDLRLQMAKIMFNNGDRPQAMREVMIVLTRQPWNVEALKLEDELKKAPLR